MKTNNVSKDKYTLVNLVLAALFLALGMMLPLLTGQLKEIGDTLLPMHLPVMLCGFICGYKYGFMTGLVLPFLRSLVFGMPPMYPNAVWMALELAAYGFMTGFLYLKISKKSIVSLYVSLIGAMLAGRIVWGIAKALLIGLEGKAFTFAAFIAGGFVDSALGIAVQLVIIPIIITAINKYERFSQKKEVK